MPATVVQVPPANGTVATVHDTELDADTEGATNVSVVNVDDGDEYGPETARGVVDVEVEHSAAVIDPSKRNTIKVERFKPPGTDKKTRHTAMCKARSRAHVALETLAAKHCIKYNQCLQIGYVYRPFFDSKRTKIRLFGCAPNKEGNGFNETISSDDVTMYITEQRLAHSRPQ